MIIGTPAAAAQAVTTRVQFVHAGTGLGDVEISLNGSETLDGFAYGTVSDWIEVDPGSGRITVSKDRAGFNYTIFDAIYPVPAGNDYYAILSDMIFITGVFDTSPTVAETSRVKVVQASVDTPAVNIAISQGDMTLATNLGYAQTSDPATMPWGSYDVEITLADTGEPVASMSAVEIEPDKSYVWVLMGTPDSSDTPLELVQLESDQVEPAGTPAA